MSKWHGYCLAFAAILLMNEAATAQEGGGIGSDFVTSQQGIEVRVDPTFEFDAAEHVANGVALRNRSAGTIHLRGIPLPRRVIRAFLYWNFSDGRVTAPGSRVVLFNGNSVRGVKTADNADPCWGLAGNHTYRADVTRFIPVNDPNQDYRVVTRFDAQTSTTGQNPWDPIENQRRRKEGAWLIVVYESRSVTGAPLKNVAIYDDLSGTTMIGQDLTATLIHPGIGPDPQGLFTMCGADGQRGPDGNRSNIWANELTFFNGVQIAGPFAGSPSPLPLSASDWDGSDGWPLVQLADTHTHQVTLNDSGVSQVMYDVGGDCLTPVAFVIEGF